MFRALRFSSQLGFSIEDNTSEAIKSFLIKEDRINKLSKERIRDELCKLLVGKNVFNVLLNYVVMFKYTIKEVYDLYDYNQMNRHHQYQDLYLHTINVVSNEL